MSEIEHMRKSAELNGLTVTVRWFTDDWVDLSLLGEFTSAADENQVDRETGLLLGEAVDEPDCPFEEMSYDEFDEFVENSPVEEYQAIVDKYDSDMAAYEEAGGCEVLASGLSTMGSHRECQFFGKSQHLPHNAANWKHVSEEDLNKAHDSAEAKLADYNIDTGSKAKDLDALGACLDYQRVIDCDRGDWFMVYCIVEIQYNGVVLGTSYIGGIESDCDDNVGYDEDGHKHNIERGLVSAALADAKRNQGGIARVSLPPFRAILDELE